MRMAVNLLLCGIIVRGHTSHPTASMLALALAVGVEILAMVYATHAPTSDYYVGLIILFVGMPVLLPLSAGHAAAICGAITLGFALAPLVTPAPIPWKEFTIRLVFLLTGCVESVLSCAFLGRVRLQDYAQRREIEKARDDLKEMDRARSRFTANVHHELRTPLTLMLAPIEAMESGEFGEVPELQRGYLKTMQVNGLRLLKLINNLLDLAKIESQQLELHCRPVELSRLASDIVSGAGPMAERKGIRLVGDGLDELPAMHADPDALEKILTNLLGNALKFTDGGGCITLAGSVEEANIHLVVRDTGVGLPTDQLERIFDRFAQVDMSATRRHEGTGIGLSLCKELVGMHGGRIWARSPGIGHGTEMHVLLPIRDAGEVGLDEEFLTTDDGRALSARQSFEALGAEIDLSETSVEDYRAVEMERSVERWERDEAELAPSEDATPVPAELPTSPRRTPEIVVAEDNADMRKLLRFLLGREFRVRVTRNGREALEAVRARPPELVLTDVMMPVMSGTELCRALKEDPETQGIPVILVTSKAEREMKIEGLELGADDYLTKPFHPRELLARVRGLVRVRTLQKELARRNYELEGTNAELGTTLEKLRQAQAQLVHREKMASVGQLVAGIAHEINNPVNFIQGNLFYLEEYTQALRTLIEGYEALLCDREAAESLSELRKEGDVDRILEDLESVFDGCREGVERTTSLVRDLRTFSRLDRPDRVRVDLHATLDSTLNLLRGRLTGIEVVRDYGDIPEIESFAGQLGQVFMNLLANAADALGRSGTIRIRTRSVAGEGPDAERVSIEIEDDGEGIGSEHLERIFDPFFTTKEVGQGTGLGLAVTYGIVERHGGSIDARSEPGVGTCFRVELPVEMEETDKVPGRLS
jgi:signal transduction histidine kinase